MNSAPPGSFYDVKIHPLNIHRARAECLETNGREKCELARKPSTRSANFSSVGRPPSLLYPPSDLSGPKERREEEKEEDCLSVARETERGPCAVWGHGVSEQDCIRLKMT